MQVDGSASGWMLMVGEDLCCVGDLATGNVLKRLIGVETAAALPELGDPRPYILGRCIDSDSQGVGPIGFGHELIAGQRISCLCSHRAPPQPSPPDERCGEQVPHNEGDALQRGQNADTGGGSRAMSKPPVVRIPSGRHDDPLVVLPVTLPQCRNASQGRRSVASHSPRTTTARPPNRARITPIYSHMGAHNAGYERLSGWLFLAAMMR